MHEQYRPTSAPLVESRSREPRSSLVALVLGGVLVDWLGTQVVATFAGMIWMIAVGVGEDPRNGWQDPFRGGLFRVSMTAIGGLMSVLGGYVAALWARHRPVMHGLGTGVASMTFGILLSLALGASEVQFHWLALATPLLGLVGGYLYERQRRPR